MLLYARTQPVSPMSISVTAAFLLHLSAAVYLMLSQQIAFAPLKTINISLLPPPPSHHEPKTVAEQPKPPTPALTPPKPAVHAKPTPKPPPKARPKVRAKTPPKPRPVAPVPASVQVANNPPPPPGPSQSTDTPIPTPAAAVTPIPERYQPPMGSANYLNNPKPSYPRMARRRGMQGQVILRVKVSAAGLPLAISVQESSGFKSLDQAALRSVRRWRFIPASRAGIAVQATVNIPIKFQLEG